MPEQWTDGELNILRRMRGQGIAWARIAARLRKNEKAVQMRYRRLVEEGEELVPWEPAKREALCWHCELATGGPDPDTGEPCHWAARLQPRPDWDAELVSLKTYNNGKVGPGTTWRVDECPGFRDERERR